MGERPRWLQAREKPPNFQRWRFLLRPNAISMGRRVPAWEGWGRGAANGLQMPAAESSLHAQRLTKRSGDLIKGVLSKGKSSNLITRG